MRPAGADERHAGGIRQRGGFRRSFRDATGISFGIYEPSGRAVHIHFKIRTNPASNAGTEFTSQLFFDDALSAEIFTAHEPYAEKGEQDVTNDRDNIFAESNGHLTLSLSQDGDGYAATFAIGVQLG